MRQIAEFLTMKLAAKSENYKNIFKLDPEFEEELQEIKPPGVKIRKYYKLSAQQKEDRKSNGDTDIPDYDFDPDSEGDDDDGNYVDMVRTAFKDTRRILGEITPGSPLWEMIYEIFNIFSGKVGELEDDYGNVKAEDKKDEKARMELLSLPKFTNYFKITPEDDLYLDNFIDRVSVLAE